MDAALDRALARLRRMRDDERQALERARLHEAESGNESPERWESGAVWGLEKAIDVCLDEQVIDLREAEARNGGA